MIRWALIDGQTVATVTIQEDQPTISGQWVMIPDEFGPGDNYIDGDFSKHVEEAATEPVRITQLAFDLRLTAEERKAIRAAAKVNDDVNDAYQLKEKATFIDLTAQITQTLLGVLAMSGCISADRIPIILDVSTVQSGDLYRGPI